MRHSIPESVREKGHHSLSQAIPKSEGNHMDKWLSQTMPQARNIRWKLTKSNHALVKKWGRAWLRQIMPKAKRSSLNINHAWGKGEHGWKIHWVIWLSLEETSHLVLGDLGHLCWTAEKGSKWGEGCCLLLFFKILVIFYNFIFFVFFSPFFMWKNLD